MIPTLHSAIKFIAEKHDGQFRKAKTVIRLPYIFHPMYVMRALFDLGLQESEHLNILLAALGHDTLEDTSCTYDELKEAIGQIAADIVVELTFDPQKMPKSEYMTTFGTKSVEALIIKIADRLCNCRDFWKSGDKEYALKYFLKAGPVWDAFEQRKQEIQDKFGDKFWNRLRASIELDKLLLTKGQ